MILILRNLKPRNFSCPHIDRVKGFRTTKMYPSECLLTMTISFHKSILLHQKFESIHSFDVLSRPCQTKPLPAHSWNQSWAFLIEKTSCLVARHLNFIWLNLSPWLLYSDHVPIYLLFCWDFICLVLLQFHWFWTTFFAEKIEHLSPLYAVARFNSRQQKDVKKMIRQKIQSTPTDDKY